MKRILLLLALIVAGCQDKHHEDIPLEYQIQGEYRGSFGKSCLHTGKYMLIDLTLTNGAVFLETHWTDIKSGWSNSSGTYTIKDDKTIVFDIEIKKSEMLEGLTSIPTIKVTHADIYDSYLTPKKTVGLTLHYTKSYSSGETTEHTVSLNEIELGIYEI